MASRRKDESSWEAVTNTEDRAPFLQKPSKDCSVRACINTWKSCIGKNDILASEAMYNAPGDLGKNLTNPFKIDYNGKVICVKLHKI